METQRALELPCSNALGQFERYWNGGSGSIGRWSLGGFRVVFQSSLFDGVAFDPFSFQEDGLASAEVLQTWIAR